MRAGRESHARSQVRSVRRVVAVADAELAREGGDLGRGVGAALRDVASARGGVTCRVHDGWSNEVFVRNHIRPFDTSNQVSVSCVKIKIALF